MNEKRIHAKPSLYAYYFYDLKEIGMQYGYNICLHGSLKRDMDLIAIPWAKELGSVEKMINRFAELLGGYVMKQTEEQRKCFPHGRESWVINLNRELIEESHPDYKLGLQDDAQYYLDISVIPSLKL